MNNEEVMVKEPRKKEDEEEVIAVSAWNGITKKTKLKEKNKKENEKWSDIYLS